MKNNSQNSCMDLLFKYYSPLAESSDIQNNSPKKENKQNSLKTSMGFKFDNIINFDELECQNFNLNGNYKKIYYYKDDDTESMTNPNESFDIKNFSFVDFDDEKNTKENNNIESINKLSNNIKKDIEAKENKKKKKNENNKNVKKSNKGNSSNTVLNYTLTEKKKANDDKNDNSKNEMENTSINNSVKIINESKLNNKSKVMLSQKNNMNPNANKNNEKNKPTNLKLINRTERKVNHYKSMDKLNSIIEDYYKSKVKRNIDKNSNNNHNNNNNNVLYTIKVNNNDTCTNNNNNNVIKNSSNNNIHIINNENKMDDANINDNIRMNKNLIEEDFNNSSINVGPGLVRVTYSSSCDNKKIRSSSAFKGTKVTVFQHFNRKHTVNNYYRDN